MSANARLMVRFLTLLDCVAWKGHDAVLKALIKAGAALDAGDKWGQTALHWAALSPRARGSGAGLARTRLTLIGAFLTLSDCVAENGHADVVEALIKAGAALGATTNNGETALMCAALSPSGEGKWRRTRTHV